MSDPNPLAYETLQSGSTRAAITAVALQLLGVYCFLQALTVVSYLGGLIGRDRPGRDDLVSVVGIALLPLLLYVIAGVLLIRFALCFAVWLVRVAPGESALDVLTMPVAQELQAIAFSVVGIVIIANTVPSLLWMIIASISSMGDLEKWRFVHPVLELAVGLVLFLQSKGLALLWHKLRTGGITTRVDEAPPAAGG